MSRCFPFPPPGYVQRQNKKKKSSSDVVVVVPDDTEAHLIESIKKEQRKAEKEKRKEKKREKKKEKKEKSGRNGHDKKSHSRREEGRSAIHKSSDFQKKKEYETEQLEKSGLSEEHGPPSCVPTCDSSDSTHNSGKRKRHSSISISKGGPNQSTMLRIRLPLVKHRDPEELLSKEQLCSTSGATEITDCKMADNCPNIKQVCSISGRTEVQAQGCSEPAPAVSSAALLNLCNSPSRLSDVHLRDIIENWVIPPIQIERTDLDDQSWLFDIPSKREPKRSKVSDVATCYNGSMWPPRACYLPEADMYALPYTVPF
ncbi:Dna ligase 1-like [Thalictrum thalictroides]|uniref:Dna ligase 1-like n=1 Tax=Thalictrum thalictroides TaxID=46969 RepID=A0A7J6WCQ2_THATH|nr:Dna ligase 1-like [Thalictrum thalictroides]